VNILFVTDDNRQGSSLMRAVWPSVWINKFTKHHSWCIDRFQSMSTQHDALVKKADLVVIHKSNPTQRRIAELCLGLGKPFVYDTDDNDAEVFDHHYNEYLIHDSFESAAFISEFASGITVSSFPLQQILGGALIENGFDTTLPNFRPDAARYHDTALKMAWGGSSTHGRDFEMFYKLGVIQQIMSEYPLDVHVYGLSRNPGRKSFGQGALFHSLQCPRGPEWYIHDFYRDADFLFAPLVSDEFNQYRSTLKLVEAGIAGKTIVATCTRSNEAYKGRDGVVLVRNTADEWYHAIKALIERKEHRDALAERNTLAAALYYSAEELTNQRIKYFEEIINV
jgi:glycosyltransferase involved in cell wall biosynthesis